MEKWKAVLNMQTENVTPFEAFSKCVSLPGLLSMMKIESERYAAQNGRQFQISKEEFCAFLGVNLLMGINKLPTMKSYWSVDEGLGNSLIQKAMKRARFLEILQNIHFADNHKELPPTESEETDRAWKLRPLFDHLGKHFQDMLQPYAHQSTDEHMCKFKGKNIMRKYMKNKPIKWGFKFWFRCERSLATCMNSICIWERKEIPNLVSVNLLFFHYARSSKIRIVLYSLTTFFTSPALLVTLLEMGIYATDNVRANQKNMPVLKYDKEMKRGEHDWFSSNQLSAIKWMNNKSVILLSNYFNPKETQQIERRVNGSKDKVKVTCPSVIQEYNQFMGSVDLSDQMKVTYKVDRRSKFRFYLRVFFNFLDIAVANSKIVYKKIESAHSLSSLDFRYSIAQTMIRKFSSRKSAVPLSRSSKRSRGPSFDIVDHLPDFEPSRVRCAFCSSKNVESRTYVRCITCNTVLCLQKDRNCFQQYHTMIHGYISQVQFYIFVTSSYST